MNTTPPTDPSLRRLYTTTEFWTHTCTVLVAWVGGVLIMLNDLGPALSDRNKALVATAVLLLTAISNAALFIGRGLTKAAAVSAVPAYLRVVSGQAGRPEAIAVAGDLNTGDVGDVGGADVASAGASSDEEDGGDIDLDSIDTSKL